MITKGVCLGCNELISSNLIPINETTKSGKIYCKPCWKLNKNLIKEKLKEKKKILIRKEVGEFEVAFP